MKETLKACGKWLFICATSPLTLLLFAAGALLMYPATMLLNLYKKINTEENQ